MIVTKFFFGPLKFDGNKKVTISISKASLKVTNLCVNFREEKRLQAFPI